MGTRIDLVPADGASEQMCTRTPTPICRPCEPPYEATPSIDVRAAMDATENHTRRGERVRWTGLDAVRVRLIEIGAAVKSPPAELLATEPHPPVETTVPA